MGSIVSSSSSSTRIVIHSPRVGPNSTFDHPQKHSSDCQLPYHQPRDLTQSDLDRFMMPPPEQVYRQGTTDLVHAVEWNETTLSLPDQATRDQWKNLEIGTYATHNKAACRDETQPQKTAFCNRFGRCPGNTGRSSSDHQADSISSPLCNHTTPHQTPSAYGQGREDTEGFTATSQTNDSEANSFFSCSFIGVQPSELGHRNEYTIYPETDFQYYHPEHGHRIGEDPNLHPVNLFSNDSRPEDSSRQQQGPPVHSLSPGSQKPAINVAKVRSTDSTPCTEATMTEGQSLGKEPNLQNRTCSDTGPSVLSGGSTLSHFRSDDIPSTTFKDIIGHQSVKLRLQEVLIPLKLPVNIYKSIFRGIRSLAASVLLFGPPGTGKTLLAKAVAGEAHAAYLPIGPSDILSKYVGESEAAVRSIFVKAANMARQTESKCAVIFFDEIDALGQSRVSKSDGASGAEMSAAGSDGCSRKVLAELLIQLTKLNSSHGKWKPSNTNVENEAERYDEAAVFDEEAEKETASRRDDDEHEDDSSANDVYQDPNDLESVQSDDPPVNILVLAATNRPQDCDAALLRRFGVQVSVGLPRRKERMAMIKHHLTEIDHTLKEKDFFRLASAMEGWSGSDLESLTRDVAMAPVRECIQEAVKYERKFQEQVSKDRDDSDDHRIEEDSHETSSMRLQEQFSKLRPVRFEDYVHAISFWRQRVNVDSSSLSPLAKLGGKRRLLDTHNDSSSSDDDDDAF